MRVKTQSEFTRLDGDEPEPLDFVIPYSTPGRTIAAIRAVERLGCGIDSRIRLLRIEAVPFPLQLSAPPVCLEFLRHQLETVESVVPLNRFVLLVRDFEPALKATLRPDSIVVLSMRRWPWSASDRRLARRLRRAGRCVLLVPESEYDV